MSSGEEATQPEAAGSSKHAFSLENILSADHESVEHPTASKDTLTSAGGWDEEAGQEQVASGFCIECEGTYFRQNQRTLGLAGLKTESVARSACPGLLRDLLG